MDATRTSGRLESVTVETPGGRREIACDAVVFTGDFVPEASLLGRRPELVCSGSHGPAIDQHWRLDDPRLYAAGNVLRGVETAAWAAREGIAAADSIAADLGGRQRGRQILIAVSGPIALLIPGMISLPADRLGPLLMQVRMARNARGRFVLSADGTEFWHSHRLTALRERRIGLTRTLPPLDNVAELELAFIEAG